MQRYQYLIITLLLFCACKSKQPADLIIYNATIYTMDSSFSIVNAMAIKNGLVVATGTNDSIEASFDGVEKINAEGKFVYPGFIDAHAHFYHYALGLQTADLVNTKSWEEILEKLKAFAVANPEGWIIGRGWDQNDWADKTFPNNEQLNQLFPNRAVLLTRVDGHAAIANATALNMAGILPGMKMIGGEVNMQNGKLTGLLIDNAVNLVEAKIPAPTNLFVTDALLKAQDNCFAQGLTTIDDCGLNIKEVLLIDSLQKKGKLKMRLYAMLSDAPDNYDYILEKGKIKTSRLNVSSFKVYADGALGSRGACLLAPYSDRKNHSGFLLSNPAHFDSVAALLYKEGFQMCTHAIGDSANRIILNTYARYLKGKNDRRWRIEHAQVVNSKDYHLFGENNIIPSVQPTHATSDMYWAGSRLGDTRIQDAYAYQQLLKENNWIPLGTDFPVEDISPFKTFYAAVVRKDAKGWPEKGFQTANALSREDALKGMTIWAAKSNVEEEEKGSLEINKLADFIILDRNLMKVPETEILTTKVISTFIQGEKVYPQKNK